MMVIKLKHALLSVLLLAFAGSWSKAIASPLRNTATRNAPLRTVAPGSVVAKTSYRSAKEARPVPPPATATAITIGASQTTVTLGDTVTFTATVTGAGTATG